MSAYGIMENGNVVKLEYPKNIEETIDFNFIEEVKSFTKEEWDALMHKTLIIKKEGRKM